MKHLILVISLICYTLSLSSQTKALAKAERLAQDKKYEEAIEAYDKILKRKKKCLICYDEKARCYYALGKYRKAIKTLEEGIEVCPDSAKLYISQSGLLVSLTMPKESAEAATKALSLIDKTDSLNKFAGVCSALPSGFFDIPVDFVNIHTLGIISDQVFAKIIGSQPKKVFIHGAETVPLSGE